MLSSIKCLGTLTIASLYSILTLHVQLCQCSQHYDIGDIITNNKDQLTLDPKELSAEDESLDAKRGWSSGFTSWGKRPSDNTFSVLNKRRWNKFATWGKRNEVTPGGYTTVDLAQSIPVKRDWSGFTSWGKRDNSMDNYADMDKRKWSGFQSWGKRNGDDMQNALNTDKKWSNFATWGKRDNNDQINNNKKWSSFASWGKRNDGLESDIDKRKWSKFAVWGKRNNFENFDEDLESSPEKRAWSKGFVSWGKRDNEELETEPSKRKWSKFATWGKRAGDEGQESEMLADKRKWSQFSSWGKRLRNARNWTWGKRRWMGLPTWGKRSSSPLGTVSDLEVDAVAWKLLKYFDINGDEALDKSELRTYIKTLMSLPSKPEPEEEKQEAK